MLLVLQVWLIGLITGAADAPAEVWIPGPGPGGGSGTLQHPWTGSGPQRPDAAFVPTAPAASAGGGAAPSLLPPPPPNLATSTAGSRRPPAGGEQEICQVKDLFPSLVNASIAWHLLEGQLYVLWCWVSLPASVLLPGLHQEVLRAPL